MAKRQMSRPQTKPKWVPPVAPESVVGTGHRWLEPVSMEGTHKAVDLQAVRNTPVQSPVSGVVSNVKNEPKGLGLQAEVTGPGGFRHTMAHMERVGVRPGTRVGTGQTLGSVGDSGAGATGPHLDYRLQDQAGNYYDPSPLLGRLAQMPRADKPGAGQGNPFEGVPFADNPSQAGPPLPDWTRAGGWGGGTPQTELPDPYWIGQGFRPMDPATEPLRLYRGDYPGELMEPWGPRGSTVGSTNYDQTTNIPSHGGRGSGQWFTDSPQLATTIYGTNMRGAPGPTDADAASWQRLLPGINGNWTRNNVWGPLSEPQMDPALVTALEVPPHRVPDVLWRHAPQWLENSRDPSSAPANAPREYIVPRDLLGGQQARFRGLGGMVNLMPPELVQLIQQGGADATQAVTNWLQEHGVPEFSDTMPERGRAPVERYRPDETPMFPPYGAPPPSTVRDQWYQDQPSGDPPVGGGQDMMPAGYKTHWDVGVGQFDDPYGDPMGSEWMNQMPMESYGQESQAGYGDYGANDYGGPDYGEGITQPYEPPSFGGTPTRGVSEFGNWFDQPQWGGPRSEPPVFSPMSPGMGGYGDSFAPMTPGGSGRFGAPSGYNYGSNYGMSAWNVPSPPGQGGYGGGGNAYTGGQLSGLGTSGTQATFPDLLSQDMGMNPPGMAGNRGGMGGQQRSQSQGGGGQPQAQSQSAARGGGNNTMPFDIPVGVFGQDKWLPGSTGTDIFVPDNSPITAKTGGRVLYAVGGTGLGGGSDQIVQFDDGTVTRFRHVQPQVQAGQTFRAGQTLARIHDDSMNMLSPGPASAIGAPSGYQHLDLSVNAPGQTQFSPQGGGGGSRRASDWLRERGYGGRMIGRTPGPQEGQMGGGGFGGQGGMPGMMPGMMPGGFGGGFGRGQDVGSGADSLTGAVPFSTQYPGPTNVPWPLDPNSSVATFGQPSTAVTGIPTAGATTVPSVTTPSAVTPQGSTQVSNTTPAGVTGATMPEIKPLDMSTMTKLTPTPAGATGDTPWLQNHKPLDSVTHTPADFSVLQPPPVIGQLGTQPYQTPYWLQGQQAVGTGEDYGGPAQPDPHGFGARIFRNPWAEGGVSNSADPGRTSDYSPVPNLDPGAMRTYWEAYARAHPEFGARPGTSEFESFLQRHTNVARTNYIDPGLSRNYRPAMPSMNAFYGAAGLVPSVVEAHQDPNNPMSAAHLWEWVQQQPWFPGHQDQDQLGGGQDVGVGATSASPGFPRAPVFMAPRGGRIPMGGAAGTFQMMQPGHGQISPPGMPMPRGGKGGRFRAPHRTLGRGQDIGVGQNSTTAGMPQGTVDSMQQGAQQSATSSGGQTQVVIDPYSQASLQQEQQRLQLSQQQINGQLQQINNNYQVSLRQLEQQFQLTGDANKLEQDKQRLQDQQFHDTQQLQMRLANVQTQQNALDRHLRQQEINNQYQTQMAKLQTDWMTHQDTQLLEQQKARLQNQWNQQSNALALVQGNKQARLQLELQKGTLGFQQEQLGVNAGLSLSQLAAQTGLSQEQMRAQTGLGIMSLGQQAADKAAERQLSLYGSALSNPWLQDLAGLAPGYNAPGGPGETGYASAQGMQARADMSRILPGGKVPDWYTGIGRTQVNQHPDYLNRIGSTQVSDWNPANDSQDYFSLLNQMGGQGDIFPDNNGFTGNFQNTWNSSWGMPNTGGLNENSGVIDMNNTGNVWSPFQSQPLSTSSMTGGGGTTGGTSGGGSAMPRFGLTFNPAGGGTMQNRPAGQNTGVTYNLPNGKTFSSMDVWNWMQANPGSTSDTAYQNFISPSYPGWNYGTNFPEGSTVQWNPMAAASGGTDMQAPGQAPTNQGGVVDPALLETNQNYVGTGQGYDEYDPRNSAELGEFTERAVPPSWRQLPPSTSRASDQQFEPIPPHDPIDNPMERFYKEASDNGQNGGGRYIGQLPPDVLSALRTNPEVGVALVEHWVNSRESPDQPSIPRDDYVGTGADVPFVMPFQNPEWLLDNSYVGAGADYSDPMANYQMGTPSTGISGGGGGGVPGFKSTQNSANTIQSGMNAAFGGSYGDYQLPSTPAYNQGSPWWADQNQWNNYWNQANQGYNTWMRGSQPMDESPPGGIDNPTPPHGSTYTNLEGNLSNEAQGIDPTTWYAGWRENFGQTGPGNPYDVNQDQLVDIRDWGQYQQGGGNINQPPPQDPNQFQLPVNPGETGYVPGPLMSPPEIPQIPDWNTVRGMTPFQRSALMTKVMMSGIPWPQFQDAMRYKWERSGGPTTTPDASILEGLNASRNPMQMRGQNQLADIFGEGPQAYWQRMSNMWAPGQSSGAMIQA